MAIKSQKTVYEFSRERIIFAREFVLRQQATRRENVKTFTELHPINFDSKDSSRRLNLRTFTWFGTTLRP